MSQLSPIVLFIFNRPLSTQKVLDYLSANAEAQNSILHIYCDGPKNDVSYDMLQKIHETRTIARKENRFKEVRIVEESINKGLSNSIIDGVTKICKEFGSVIVLEDDIITSPFFLQYMNQALVLYKDVEGVGSINGYWYPVKEKMPDTFFLKNQSCWGWATWEREWNLFESDGLKLHQLLKEKKLGNDFDLDGAIGYTKMLSDQIAKKNDSWAIRWDASMFLAEKVSLYPGMSLVKNIGFDGSGVHCDITDEYTSALANEPIKIFFVSASENLEARKALINFYKSNRKKHLIKKVYSLLGLIRKNT